MKAIREQNGLRLVADADDLALLRELKDERGDAFQSDDVMCEFFEDFCANSEFGWILPEECGALTSAPILGVRSLLEDGNDGPVTEAYGFMDYQIVSVQERLLETGEAFFQKG